MADVTRRSSQGAARRTVIDRPRGTKQGSESETLPADEAQSGEAESGQAMGTRERILDIALDLFIDKGYDKTSLREIAEKVGFSKAALYYHFASKDDILMALHQRLHVVLQETLTRLTTEENGVTSWTILLDRVIDQMLANRRLFVLHERNRAAFEQLHKEGHDDEHDDFEGQFRRILADTGVPLKDRVRLACSVGAVMSGLFLAGDLFSDVAISTLGDLLRDAVRDLLGTSPAP
jgi:AcrR family transcriptional regulator